MCWALNSACRMGTPPASAPGGHALEQAGNGHRQVLISTAMLRAGSDAGDVLDSLIRGLGMPRSLRAVKIGRDNFQRIAVQAMATPWVPRNPRPIEGPDQVREILELAS